MTSAMRTHYTLARLYVSEVFGAGVIIGLPQSQAHYLSKVMRLKPGAQIRVFNGDDGEWLAELSELGKRDAQITLLEQLRPTTSTPDIWVLFAPVKKSRNDFIVEKATELGASLIQPVLTKRTTMPHIKTDRMRLQAIEAAEQTERMDIPLIKDPFKLAELIESWDAGRALIFADEAGDAQPAIEAFKNIKAPCAILIGPEGGFDPSERDLLRAQSFVTPISLGPRILRADTAVAATLALWQAVNGDWDASL
jgi:16S rRNA (uracil1498-N3)-methyltransferase